LTCAGDAYGNCHSGAGGSSYATPYTATATSGANSAGSYGADVDTSTFTLAKTTTPWYGRKLMTLAVGSSGRLTLALPIPTLSGMICTGYGQAVRAAPSSFASSTTYLEHNTCSSAPCRRFRGGRLQRQCQQRLHLEHHPDLCLHQPRRHGRRVWLRFQDRCLREGRCRPKRRLLLPQQPCS
jgi:hypothetical protein